MQRVAAAAQAVLGRPVQEQQPLMEAGLDSLGENDPVDLHPII